MFEQIMQKLDEILSKQNLGGETQVSINRIVYARRRVRFGQDVERMIQAGIILGQFDEDGNPVSKICFSFPRVNPNVDPTNVTSIITVTRKDKMTIVKIKFKSN